MSFLVDVALGVLLMAWLYRDNHISMLANALVPAADVSQAPCFHSVLKAAVSRGQHFGEKKLSSVEITIINNKCKSVKMVKLLLYGGEFNIWK